MQKRISSKIYLSKEIIDGLIARTIHVRNTTVGQPLPVDEWVCFLKPEDSYESELVSHLPQSSPLSVTLTDILVTQEYLSANPDVWKEPPRTLNSKQFKEQVTFYKQQVASFRAEAEIVSSLLNLPSPSSHMMDPTKVAPVSMDSTPKESAQVVISPLITTSTSGPEKKTVSMASTKEATRVLPHSGLFPENR
jgi:hypothetical protein